MTLSLDSPLGELKGLRRDYIREMEQKGLFTLEDLLYYLPFRYEDRTRFLTIDELTPGVTACVRAEVATGQMVRYRGRGGRGSYNLAVDDKTGILYAKWFYGDYLQKVFKPGVEVILYGKVEEDPYRPGQRLMLQPQYDVITPAKARAESTESGRIVPIYEAAGKASAKVFRRYIYQALERLGPRYSKSQPPDPLPEEFRKKYGYPDRWSSLQQTHFPPPEVDLGLIEEFRTPGQVRLIYEDFFFLQLGLALKRRRQRKARGIAFELNDRARESIKKILPFHPTDAQKRVLKEIAGDMNKPTPMNRLLQGDVGSGKTIVGFEAAVIAIENGYQVALMAPTEILAMQHYLGALQRFQDTPYKIGLVISAQTAKEKRRERARLASGETNLVIGTHALIEKDIEFHKLGLIIVDEQHRFGVLQRLQLIRKADNKDAHADVLVMTATPIPRTLALTLYSDLDMSVLDEMPPGRTPITTRWITEDGAAGVWDSVRRQVAEGRQAYIVYPVIEESKLELKAATEEFEKLSQTEFKDLKVALLHGKMKTDQKSAVMEAFRNNETQVLVSTTVVEVGVDVPNATVMVIEHAERFGLSQLHQLRGRIGRSNHASYCFLLTPNNVGDLASQRLQALTETQDGFKIAEMDLKLRGPGDFVGTKQSGFVNFRIANLLRDQELLQRAKEDAFAFAAQESPALEKATAYLRKIWRRRFHLMDVA